MYTGSFPTSPTMWIAERCHHPCLACVPRAGFRLHWWFTRLQRFLDALDLLRTSLGQPPDLLLLLADRRQARKWRRWLDRGAVGQSRDGLAQRQVGAQAGGAPALGIPLRLPDVGGAHLLHVPELAAFHPQTYPRTAIGGNAGRLTSVVPERPALAGLDPARGNRGGAKAVGVLHGRKNTAGRRRSCERGGDLPESFGLSAGAALLRRLRVERPTGPDPASPACPARLTCTIGQQRGAASDVPYAASRCS